MRWVALAGLLFVGAAAALVIVNRDRIFGGDNEHAEHATVVTEPPVTKETPPPAAPADPAAELVASALQLADAGKTQAAIDSLVKARKVYPNSAALALTVGKLYLGKMWWNDGISNLRDAIKLDPSLRGDPEILKLALRGYITTPAPDERLARFLLELDPAKTKAVLQAAADEHPSPDVRSRLQNLARRVH